jgi:hypothetical protein
MTTSIKRLRSVIQGTAHHAVSGLCYVHPHLGRACKESRINSITVDLKEPIIEPVLATITKEIELSTNALRIKFSDILATEEIAITELDSAKIVFNFLHGEWPTSCYVEAITVQGKRVEVAVDSVGKTAEILES